MAAELPAGGVAVDVGAGPGLDTAGLRARGLRAVGLDFSLGMLRAGAAESPGPRVQGDARRLPFGDEAVAGVWAKASLLHLSRTDAQRALDEVRRVLRPAGLLFVSVKSGDGSEVETARYGLPRFFQYWSGEDLDGALVGAGFTVIERRTDTTDRATWLVRLARRSA